MKTKKTFKTFLLAAAAVAAFVFAQGAWATFITPKRVMIEDKQRTATITIHNTSDKTTAYRFGWEHRSQTADGQSIFLKDGETAPGYKPAESMLQFSPRQVILKPNENQKLRILVKRPADLPDGEYHSHLLIKTEVLEDAEKGPQTQQGLVGTLQIQTNASIPVFLRQGQTSINVKLTSAEVVKKDGRNLLEYRYENNSTRSVYAIPELDCVGAPPDTKPIILNTARIYAESKSVTQAPPIPENVLLTQCSALKLRLVAINDFEFKRQTITEINVTK